MGTGGVLKVIGLIFFFLSVPFSFAEPVSDYQGNGVSSLNATGTRNPLDIQTIVSGSPVDPRTRSWNLGISTDGVFANITQLLGSAPSATNPFPFRLSNGTSFLIGQTTASGALPVVLASDQSGINKFLDSSGSDSITSLNDAVTITTNGASTVFMNITGTWVATVTLQGDSGDGNWSQALGILPFPSGALASSIGSNVSIIIPVGGYKQIRLVATAFTSGTASVAWNAGTGTNAVQVFNNLPGSLQVTANAGTNLNTSALALSANQTNGSQKTMQVDGSGNIATFDTVTGTGSTKISQNTSETTSGKTRYFTSFQTQQTAATAANATVWAMRNAAASTRSVFLESISCRMGFNAANPVIRTEEGYVFQRFSGATPTGGTAMTAGLGDTTDAASQVTDIRFLDTGLTTAGVTFVANNLATMMCDTTQGISCQQPILVPPAGIKLAPGEGLAMRLDSAAVAGMSIGCNIAWREQ